MIDPLINSSGEQLDFEFRPGRSGASELVLIGHGVTANKDRPWLVALSDALSELEIASLRISFSGRNPKSLTANVHARCASRSSLSLSW